MGDGRYYTPEQFFSIIHLTVLIIFMTVTIMLSLYKGSGNKTSKQILRSSVMLGIIAVLSFIEAVMVTEQMAFIIRFIISIMFIGVNFLFVRFNLNSVVDGANKHRQIRKFKQFFYTVVGSTLIVSFFRPELLIVSYNFNDIKYGLIYIVVSIISLIYLLYSIFFIMRNPNKNMDFKFNKKVFLVVVGLFWVFPMFIYIGGMIRSIENIKIVQFIAYMLMAICLNMVSGIFTPYRVGASVFNDVRKLILDYVFIIDEKGKIIYKVNRIEKSGIFNDVDCIDIENISLIFNRSTMIREAYSKQFIKYIGERILYFGYSKKPIIENQKVEGYIITFTDITELINMLDELKMKQAETVEANTKLSRYKDQVYGIEKEKEINTLLDEIANNQQKSMLELKAALNNLKGSQEDEYVENIAKIITTAKHNLQDVREAVTAYMSYYEV